MAFINNIGFKSRLQVGAETVVRALPFGANWRRIRIGWRCSLADTLSDITNVTCLAGVAQGAYGWPDPTCPDAVAAGAASTGLNVGTTWNRLRDGSGNMAYRGGGGSLTYWKRFNTVSQSGTNSSSSGYIPLTHTGQLGGFLITLENLGTTFFSNCYTSTAANISRATLLAAMENDPNPAGFVTQANNTVAYAGSAQLTHAFIFWNHTTPSMDICDFVVTRYY